MVTDEFRIPQPQPRRAVKREEDLLTFTIMDAVTKVFLYQQPVFQFEETRLLSQTSLPLFHPGNFWGVLNTLMLTHEVILDTWCSGLEYTIGTSMQGMNVMTSICQKIVMDIGD